MLKVKVVRALIRLLAIILQVPRIFFIGFCPTTVSMANRLGFSQFRLLVEEGLSLRAT